MRQFTFVMYDMHAESIKRRQKRHYKSIKAAWVSDAIMKLRSLGKYSRYTIANITDNQGACYDLEPHIGAEVGSYER